MNRLSCAVAAVLGTLAVGGSGRADYMNWSYTWDLNKGPTFTAGHSLVSFALNSDKTPGAATVAVGNLSTNSTSPSTDSFNAPYNLTLTLTDNATNASGALTFHGTLAGNVGPTSSTLTNTISDPAQSLTLSGHLYSVTLPGTTPISAPDKSPTAFNGQVLVSVAGSHGPPPASVPAVQNPEPSGLLLAVVGLSLCGAARRRRRGRSGAV
jgi:hypothetical protein